MINPSCGVRQRELDQLGIIVLQRDWLSANHVIAAATDGSPATIVDTGYTRHSPMTLALIDHAISGAQVQRIVNTHLHSDHCGGNFAIQRRYPAVETLVPALSYEAAKSWDPAQLSYRATGQCCVRFSVSGKLAAGDTLRFGSAQWQVHGASGHDPDALMLFEPQTRTLIAGDALWEDRLAIIFPELNGEDGFGATRETLQRIENLSPKTVIPGHGPVFNDLKAALSSSRMRLATFEADPQRHIRHAARALLMFHMMEHQHRMRQDLEQWLLVTRLFTQMAKLAAPKEPTSWGRSLISSLIDDGLLNFHQGILTIAGQT